MQFLADHVIERISLKDFEALFFDEAYNEAMCGAVKLSRELISREDDQVTLRRVVQVGPQREIPRALQKAVGQSRITYTEHISYRWGEYNGQWHTVSSVLPDKVEAHGDFSFVAEGENVRQIVRGEVRVKVFAIGGVIERFVVADTERTYAKAAEYMQQIIDSGPPR